MAFYFSSSFFSILYFFTTLEFVYVKVLHAAFILITISECERLRIGREFLKSQDWPEALKNAKHDRCYCDQCYPTSPKDTFDVGGKTYVIPRGWTRFGVYIDEPFTRHHNVWKTWVNCYHGTSIDCAKSIVEHRQLLLPRDKTMEGEQLQIREGHIPGEYFFFTTPTIRYAALDCYAYEYDFKSPRNNKVYKIRVALQCKQKPDSFIIQPETVGARRRKETICPHIPNEEIEWKTQHRASIMPYGLMLRLENKSESKDDIKEITTKLEPLLIGKILDCDA